ncbi:MAG: glycosyltransferase family 4 protein [Candidatus Omnitrophica bacterium]|nr:glycosyltransferase family 4 protein [Candidatus Omnitrophota bacterium]
MRILALATHGEAGPSTRFRVLQWAPYLRQMGCFLSLKAFFSAEMTVAFYQPGRVMAKAAEIAAGTARRWATLASLSKQADALLIHRELFPLGRRPFWGALERFPGPVIYDYDDAMFLPQRAGRGILGRLENVETPKAVMRRSDVVLAGNQFLADYARPYARRVVVLPTCIDTGRFVPRPASVDGGGTPVVGWIGSYTAAKYLHSLAGALREAARTAPFRLYAIGSDALPVIEGVQIEQVEWELEREVEDFQRCDIGLYPLWDDAWARGKCAFKAIQFMACGVPVLASAIGMNLELIQDGVNGYLASTREEWVDKLTRLFEDPQLRLRLGRAGRQTVEARYAAHVHAPTLLGVLRETLNGRSDA